MKSGTKSHRLSALVLVGGLLLASLLAAIMSTADAQMVVSSGLFTENIYRRFLVRGRSEGH